jgi:polysaccharide biosynthesis protein PelD
MPGPDVPQPQAAEQISGPASESNGKAPGAAMGGTQAPATGLQILPPAAALIELAVMMLGLLFLEWSLPNLDIVNLQPSPYWIPVLLLSLQYGTPSGSLAAILAIAIYFTFGNFPEQGVGENEFTYRLRILVQPILWIAAAVLLGQFRMVQIATKQELTQRLVTLESQSQVLADYSTRLRHRCDVLERTIAGRPLMHGSSLLEAIAALPPPGPACDPGTLSAAVGQCLAAAFPDATSSVFVRNGDKLDILARTGWSDDAAWHTSLAKGHPLYTACVETQRSLTVLEARHEPFLDHQGIAAVPIFASLRTQTSTNADVIGILKIERIDGKGLTAKLPLAMAALAANLAPNLAPNIAQGALVDVGATGLGLDSNALHTNDLQRPDVSTVSAIAVDLIRPKVMR